MQLIVTNLHNEVGHLSAPERGFKVRLDISLSPKVYLAFIHQVINLNDTQSNLSGLIYTPAGCLKQFFNKHTTFADIEFLIYLNIRHLIYDWI